MRCRSLLLWGLSSVALWLSVPADAKSIAGSKANIAGWELGAYTFGDTEKFSHCAITAPYRSGISMVFAVSDNFSWRVGWTHNGWNLVKDQTIDLKLYIDGAGPYTVSAKAVNSSLVLAELASTTAIFDAFRKGYVLTVFALGNKYAFNLDGTYAALTEVLECTRRYADGPAATPPPPMTPPASPAPRPVAPAVAPMVTADQRLEATTLVANILGQGDLTNFKILTAKERKELDENGSLDSWHVIWRADDLLGLLRIVPKGLVSSSTDLATALLSDDARNCKGKFASGSMPDEKGKSVVRLFTGCSDKSGSFEYRYTVVPIEDGALYVFASVGKSRDGERPENVEKADQLLRAAVFNIMKK